MKTTATETKHLKTMILKSMYFNVQRAKQGISWASIILITCLSSACQLTAPLSNITSDSINYSQYYLWLKSLDNEQLLQEEQLLLTSQQDQEDTPFRQGKFILLYSLPNPVLYQPYKAKRLLNELLLVSHNMSQDNVAFTMLLRDQLNIQLKLLEKKVRAGEAFTKQQHEQRLTIEQLTKQLQQVNQQLLLLKQIDQNINQRG